MTVHKVFHGLFTESDSDGDFILKSEKDVVNEEVLCNAVVINIFDMQQTASDLLLVEAH